MFRMQTLLVRRKRLADFMRCFFFRNSYGTFRVVMGWFEEQHIANVLNHIFSFKFRRFIKRNRLLLQFIWIYFLRHTTSYLLRIAINHTARALAARGQFPALLLRVLLSRGRSGHVALELKASGWRVNFQAERWTFILFHFDLATENLKMPAKMVTVQQEMFVLEKQFKNGYQRIIEMKMKTVY